MYRLLAVLLLVGCATVPTVERSTYSDTGRWPGSMVTKSILGSSLENFGSGVSSSFSGNIGGCTFDGAGGLACTALGNFGSMNVNGLLQDRNDAFRLSFGTSGTAFFYNSSNGSNIFNLDSSTWAWHSGTITGDASTTITLSREDAIAQKIGTGAGSISLMGALGARSTPSSNVSTGETDLQVVNLGASSLTTTGHCVSLKARGVTANNANVKTVKVYFGTTAIITASMTTSIVGAFTAEYVVCRTGSSAQRYDARLEEVNTGTNAVTKVFVTQGTLTETETNALPMKLTGTSGTASNDITENQSITYFQ